MSWKKIKNVLGTVAPFVGSLVGGPLGGFAFKKVAQVLLGKDAGSMRELELALSNATPDQLFKLKNADLEFKKEMAKLGVTEIEIAAMDRDSARKRQIVVGDHIPGILAIGLTLGFFGVLVLLMFCPMEKTAQGVIDVMLGALGTAWVSAITYYFGSSAGSVRKTELISHQ